MSFVFLRSADNAALDLIIEPLAAPGERTQAGAVEAQEPPFSLSDTQQRAHRKLKEGADRQRKTKEPTQTQIRVCGLERTVGAALEYSPGRRSKTWESLSRVPAKPHVHILHQADHVGHAPVDAALPRSCWQALASLSTPPPLASLPFACPTHRTPRPETHEGV